MLKGLKLNMLKRKRWATLFTICIFCLWDNVMASPPNVDSLRILAQTAPFPDRINHLIEWYSSANGLFREPEIAMMKKGVEWLESLPQRSRKQSFRWTYLQLMLASMYADNEELEKLFKTASSVVVMVDSLGNGEAKWIRQQGQAYFFLSFVAGLEGRSDVKISQLEKAYRCFNKIGHKKLMAQTLGTISAAQNEGGNPEKAYETCDRAAQLYREIGSEYDLLRILIYQSAYLIGMQKWKESEAMLLQLIPKLKETQHVSYNIAIANLGEVYLNQKKYKDAESYLLEALTLAKERQINTTIAYVFENLVELEETKGNYHKALSYQKEHARYTDSINVQSRDKELKEAQAKFDQTENEMKIKELEQKIAAERWTANLKLLLLTGGSLTVGGLAFWFFQQKKKKEIAAAARSLTINLQADENVQHQPLNPFLEEFLTIVKKQVANESLSVESIAQTMRMSRVQLFKKVKSATGASPSTIIREYRLEVGKKLLMEKSLTVSEIAFQVGFSNLNSFGRAFKERFGCSPTQFMKN